MSKFLEKSKVLLVSQHVSHRSGLRKTLIDLGINNKSVLVASDYQQAKDLLATEDINILVSDEEIGKDKHGTDLLELHRRSHKGRETRFFILLMDTEISPFALADFTLKGGDLALSKPFKNEQFVTNFKNLISEKEKLSADDKYMLSIEDLIALEDTANAKELLLKFAKKDSVQYFYSSGLIAEAENLTEEAFQLLHKCNSIKPGFKSLVSLVRTGAKLKKYKELKDFVEAWLYEYPIHHGSIMDITRVIIVNKKFDLLDQLFKIFSTHNINDSFARIPLAAGFVMVSTEALTQGNKEKAKEFALKGIEYSNKKIPILLKAIENLVSAGDKDEAEKAYLKNSFDTSNLDEQVWDLRIRGAIYPKSKLIVECMKLIDQKVSHPELYAFTILCLKEIGKDPGEIISKAKRAFPKINFE